MSSFGGDDVSAIVLETGSTWTKCGFSGDDAPKSVVMTDYGYSTNENAMDVEGGSGAQTRDYFVGDSRVLSRRDGMDIGNPIQDGIVQDWDAMEKIWEYSFSNLHLKTAGAPTHTAVEVNDKEGDQRAAFIDDAVNKYALMYAEPTFNTRESREKAAEIFFEKYGVSGFFLCKNAVLASFASQKYTSLVIDIGGGMMSVAPVVDGYVLKKCVVSQPIGGNALSDYALRVLQDELSIKVQPSYMISDKKPVEPGRPANVRLRDVSRVKPSYEAFMKRRVANNYKETVCQVADRPIVDDAMLSTYASKSFEFPDGYNYTVGAERFRIAEALFDPRALFPAAAPADGTAAPAGSHVTPAGQATKGIMELIYDSVIACDADTRQTVLQTTILTGGGSLMTGLNDRLNGELLKRFGSFKCKLAASTNATERRFSSWIGGSILASLGSFHQMWVSKQDYEDAGRTIVEKKCP